MRALVFFVLLFAMVTSTPKAGAQKKYTIENVQEITLRNVGPIWKENEVKGYCLFYKTDKKDRKTNTYLLQVLDQNLNKVKELPFDDSKELVLNEARYNQSSMAFLFTNFAKNQQETRVYDLNGNIIGTYESPVNKTMELMLQMGGEKEAEAFQPKIYDIENRGYLYIAPSVGMGSYSFMVNFYSSEKQGQWSVSTKNEGYTLLEYLGSTKNQILLLATSGRRSNLTLSLVAFDITSGAKSFETPLGDEQFVFYPVNLSAENNSGHVLTGYYFDAKKKLGKSPGLGLAVWSIDEKGKSINKVYNTWAEDFAGHLSDPKALAGNPENQVIQKAISTAKGLFVVSEAYREGEIGDLVLIQLDNKYKITKVSIVPKTHNKAAIRNPVFGSLTTSALAARYSGEFDYQFAARDRDGESFMVHYTDYVRRSKKIKPAIGTIRYDGNKITTDKMEFEAGADNMTVLPAAAGNVLIVEFIEDEKLLEMRLEKLG